VYAEIPEHRAEDGVLDRVESVLFSAHDEAVSVPGGLAQRRGQREALSVVELGNATDQVVVRDHQNFTLLGLIFPLNLRTVSKSVSFSPALNKTIYMSGLR
jgi:hypothetical protein